MNRDKLEPTGFLENKSNENKIDLNFASVPFSAQRPPDFQESPSTSDCGLNSVNTLQEDEFAIERKKLQRKILTLENDVAEMSALLKKASSEELMKYSLNKGFHPSQNAGIVWKTIAPIINEREKLLKDQLKLNTEIDNLKVDLSNSLSENKRLQLRIETYKLLTNEKDKLQSMYDELKKENLSSDELCRQYLQELGASKAEHNLKIRDLEIQNQKLKTLIQDEKSLVERVKNDFQLQLNDKDKFAAGLTKELENIKHQLLDKSQELEVQLDTCKSVEVRELLKLDEIQKLKNEIASALKQVNQLKEEKKTIELSCEQDRDRLAAFAVTLNRKKYEISTQLQFLLNEYESAEITHPLKDYLDFTSHEINRLEKQIRRTPTVSIDRVQLESSLQTLSEQQEFLESVINKRKIDLEIRIKKIKEVLEKFVLDLVPPPPPPSRGT